MWRVSTQRERDTNMSRRSGKRASGGEIQRGQPKFKRRAAEVIQPNFAVPQPVRVLLLALHCN
ncbi:hypothetical protein GQ600_7201 [Phytophthora cactorum]|nr:hypothetical protein GQ600_7201 [Phytophthora cactorum]